MIEQVVSVLMLKYLYDIHYNEESKVQKRLYSVQPSQKEKNMQKTPTYICTNIKWLYKKLIKVVTYQREEDGQRMG